MFPGLTPYRSSSLIAPWYRHSFVKSLFVLLLNNPDKTISFLYLDIFLYFSSTFFSAVVHKTWWYFTQKYIRPIFPSALSHSKPLIKKLITHQKFWFLNTYIHTIYIQYTYNIHTIYIQYTYNILTIYIQYTFFVLKCKQKEHVHNLNRRWARSKRPKRLVM